MKAYLIEPIDNTKAQKTSEQKGWFDRMTEGISDAAQWTWGTHQGDFNKDPPTVDQIIVNTAITMIPVVDQLVDARDIGANLRLLVWKKRYNDYIVWVGLTFCIIGLFPTVGSLLKGVLKMVWKGAGLDNILKVFNHFAKGNGVKFLNKLKDTELDNIYKFTVKKFDTIISAISDKLMALRRLLGWAGKQIDELMDAITHTRKNAKSMFQRIFAEMREKIDEVLSKKN